MARASQGVRPERRRSNSQGTNNNSPASNILTGMRRILLGCVVAGVLCALGAAADAPLLPNQFGPWQAEAPAKTLRAQDLSAGWAKWPNGERVLAEAGVYTIEERTYRNGGNEIRLQVIALRDPSSAYEVYTFLLSPGMVVMEIGRDSAESGGMFFHVGQGRDFVTSDTDGQILIGNLVVLAKIPASSTKPREMKEWKESLNDLKNMVLILQAKADQTPMPPVKDYLPERGRTFGSEKYALGPEAFRSAMSSLGQEASKELTDAVGFQNGAEAMLANYHGAHGAGVLVLLDYPTPQLAEQHLHHLEQALPDTLKKAGVTVERKASLLSLVFGATSAEYARAMRDAVNYETQVTWNERGQKATEPPIMLMMYKIFLFTGLFLGVATGVGIAFGGFRVIVKRLFP